MSFYEIEDWPQDIKNLAATPINNKLPEHSHQSPPLHATFKLPSKFLPPKRFLECVQKSGSLENNILLLSIYLSNVGVESIEDILV